MKLSINTNITCLSLCLILVPCFLVTGKAQPEASIQIISFQKEYEEKHGEEAPVERTIYKDVELTHHEDLNKIIFCMEFKNENIHGSSLPKYSNFMSKPMGFELNMDENKTGYWIASPINDLSDKLLSGLLPYIDDLLPIYLYLMERKPAVLKWHETTEDGIRVSMLPVDVDIKKSKDGKVYYEIEESISHDGSSSTNIEGMMWVQKDNKFIILLTPGIEVQKNILFEKILSDSFDINKVHEYLRETNYPYSLELIYLPITDQMKPIIEKLEKKARLEFKKKDKQKKSVNTDSVDRKKPERFLTNEEIEQRIREGAKVQVLPLEKAINGMPDDTPEKKPDKEAEKAPETFVPSK